jgi:molybdopterin converting factor subunit 1
MNILQIGFGVSPFETGFWKSRGRGTPVARYPLPMQLNVLFFGLLRDVFGTSETITVPDDTTVADLVSYYRDKAPHLAKLWDSIAVSVNEQYATASQPLADNDEVALLPPVSGGYDGSVHAD